MKPTPAQLHANRWLGPRRAPAQWGKFLDPADKRALLCRHRLDVKADELQLRRTIREVWECE